MNPDDAFERILASLHQAALDDAHWPAASALIDETAGASGSALLIGEGFNDEFRVNFASLFRRGESRQDVLRQYFDRYWAHDAGVRRLRGLSAGQLVHMPDLYTEDERKTSPAYNEGWRLLGGQNGLNVHFDEPDGLRLVWAIGDPVAGNGWQSAQRRLIERLLPHVRQFVRVRQALAAAGASDAGLAGLLDNSRIGVVQLDRGGRVLEANAPALEILRRGDGLFDRGGALRARLPADNSRLQKLVGRALPDLWGETRSGGSMTVRRQSVRSRLGLHVSPVGDGAGDFGGRRVAALVLLVDPSHGPHVDAQRVAVTLGLTGSEARVSALLAEGLRVREIAAATGLAESYVRWLFQQVYGKLGLSGQVALVRQVLAADALPRG
ncbi:MAG: helix-turn-helix transcriptional regulator [Acidobacteria bacterium]|nr:helix-turn-helix transcriptional regulator [Acidobacteriota bacterium]